MLLRELDELISRNDIDGAKKIINHFGAQRDTSTVPELIRHLLDTNNNILRNAIAMALSDIGCTEAVDPLIKLLNDPKTKSARGTLLYALESFDCSFHAEMIVDLLSDDSFEVSRQSFMLLQSMTADLSEEMKGKCIQKIQYKMSYFREKIEFLSDSLELFVDTK